MAKVSETQGLELSEDIEDVSFEKKIREEDESGASTAKKVVEKTIKTVDPDLKRSSSSRHNTSVFSFSNVSFSVEVKSKSGKGKEEKVIVQNISSSVQSGHVLAILGPSGAGKTTLINALTLNAFGGTTTGQRIDFKLRFLLSLLKHFIL